MLNKIQAIRGMNDILPEQVSVWQKLEKIFRMLTKQYGYQEIRLPILEKTELFKRCIGDVTDIVEKEMYSFLDRNEDSLSLRPEGTAGCVRAGIQQGLLYNQIQRWWYLGPMFRHERPQKGRYRQFHQFGVEVFGISQPEIDAELIFMTMRLWTKLGLENQLTLQINSLGSPIARHEYKQKLVNYFNQRQNLLDEDSKRRLQSNPLRILDSKNPNLKGLIQHAPSLLNFIDKESIEHFTELQALLEKAGIPFVVNPRLVRGLDYYNKTVFEWVITEEQGAQNTICAGGRYDNLVEQLGGCNTPAAGFALGLERLVNLFSSIKKLRVESPDVYFISVNGLAKQQALIFSEQLRNLLPNLSLVFDCGNSGIKTQFKHADKSKARFALVLGEDELKSNSITVKDLKQRTPQETLSKPQLIQKITQVFDR